LLRWSLKELPDQIKHVSRLAMQFFLETSLKPEISGRVQSLSWQIIDRLLEHIDDAGIALMAPSMLVALVKWVQSMWPVGIASYEVDLKTAAYSVIERLAKRQGKAMVGSLGALLAAGLFRTLPREDAVLTVKLLASLGALRISWQSVIHQLKLDCGSAYSSKDVESMLSGVLRQAVDSSEPKCRQAALHWMLSLYGPSNRKSIETMLLLSDDVYDALAVESRTCLCRLGALFDTFSGGVVSCGNSDDDIYNSANSLLGDLIRIILDGTIDGFRCCNVTRPRSMLSAIQLLELGLVWFQRLPSNQSYSEDFEKELKRLLPWLLTEMSVTNHLRLLSAIIRALYTGLRLLLKIVGKDSEQAKHVIENFRNNS
jgi:hypothetical protein